MQLNAFRALKVILVQISSTFAWVRDYISEKKMFRKNGLQTRVGLVDLYLNMELFSVLASFFMGDATPVTREHYELLRLSSEASAHAIQQLSMLVDRGRYFTKEYENCWEKVFLMVAIQGNRKGYASRSVRSPSASRSIQAG